MIWEPLSEADQLSGWPEERCSSIKLTSRDVERRRAMSRDVADAARLCQRNLYNLFVIMTDRHTKKHFSI